MATFLLPGFVRHYTFFQWKKKCFAIMSFSALSVGWCHCCYNFLLLLCKICKTIYSALSLLSATSQIVKTIKTMLSLWLYKMICMKIVCIFTSWGTPPAILQQKEKKVFMVFHSHFLSYLVLWLLTQTAKQEQYLKYLCNFRVKLRCFNIL